MLRRALAEHPDIQFLEPERPEPRTFLASDTPLNASQYERLFGQRTGSTLGEKSTSYLDRPDSAATIAKALPEAKILAIVREPWARAVSHYRFSVQHGAETLDMASAFTAEAERRPYDSARYSVSPFLYLARGRYVGLLQPWLDTFGVARLHVVVLEQLLQRPALLASVHRFLGVEERPGPSLAIANPSSGPTPEIPADRIREIRRSFVESNRELAARFGLDLEAWRE